MRDAVHARRRAARQRVSPAAAASRVLQPVGNPVDEWLPTTFGQQGGRRRGGRRGGGRRGQSNGLSNEVAADEGLAPLPEGLVAQPWADLQATHMGADDCAVCLEPLRDVAESIVQLSCRHSYCSLCVRQLMQLGGGMSLCPQCRAPIA